MGRGREQPAGTWALPHPGTSAPRFPLLEDGVAATTAFLWLFSGLNRMTHVKYLRQGSSRMVQVSSSS